MGFIMVYRCLEIYLDAKRKKMRLSSAAEIAATVLDLGRGDSRQPRPVASEVCAPTAESRLPRAFKMPSKPFKTHEIPLISLENPFKIPLKSL